MLYIICTEKYSETSLTTDTLFSESNRTMETNCKCAFVGQLSFELGQYLICCLHLCIPSFSFSPQQDSHNTPHFFFFLFFFFFFFFFFFSSFLSSISSSSSSSSSFFFFFLLLSSQNSRSLPLNLPFSGVGGRGRGEGREEAVPSQDKGHRSGLKGQQVKQGQCPSAVHFKRWSAHLHPRTDREAGERKKRRRKKVHSSSVEFVHPRDLLSLKHKTSCP